MRTVAITFLLGVWLFQLQSELPTTEWLYLLLPFILIAYFYSKSRPIVVPIIGFLWALLFAVTQISDTLSPSLEGHDLLVTGTVVSLPVYDEKRTSFEFTIKNLRNIDVGGRYFESDDNYPEKVRLNWFGAEQLPQPGQHWRFLLRLKRPHGYMNPGGFDREQWLFKNKIGATGYVVTPKEKHLEKLNSQLVNLPLLSEPQSNLNMLRFSLRQSILEVVSDSEYKGLLSALTIGDRQYISAEQWQVLSATGTNHLMAISGLHIGLVAGLLFFLGRWVWTLWPRLLYLAPAAKAGAICAILGAFVYAGLAGFSIPTQRAVIMVLVVMLSLLVQRKISSASILSLALLCVLLLDPMASTDVGFWLSFTAVAVILYSSSGRLSVSGWWWKWGRIQFVIFIGLFPILLIIYGNISLLSPLANTVAIPWVSFITVPFALAGSSLISIIPPLGAAFLNVADWSLVVMWPVLDWLAQQDMFQFNFFTPPAWTLLLALIGMAWLLAPRGVPGKSLAILCGLPLVLLKPQPPEYGEVRFTLLDVGQGLAAVVQTQNHTLLFDSGPKFRTGFNTGDAVIIPFLRHQGIDRLDRFIVSHSDTDHIGGAESVGKAVKIVSLVSSEPDAVRGIKTSKIETCVGINDWIWDGVTFKILHPGPGYTSPKGDNNNTSCVLKIETNTGETKPYSILLPGDIEKSAETHLLRSHRSNKILKSDLLVAPHHGSRTSSSPGFVDAVQADYVLFPVGYRNRYGFPKPQVLERYLQRGTQVFDTARDGAICFNLGPNGVERVDQYRRSNRRYWHTTIRNW